MERSVQYTSRIMLVDEDADLLEMLREYLTQKRTARVDCESDSLAALNSHLDHPCDVVVLSTCMVDMHYSKFVDHLTAVGRPRVILMAPRVDAHQILSALRLGVADVLTKPFELDELWQAVEQLVESRRREAYRLRKRRRMRENLRAVRLHNRALQQRVDLLSRDLVGAYRRLARRFAELQP